MALRRIVKEQYAVSVDNAARSVAGLPRPKEGWIRTVRKALGMSGAQLARRMGITRAAISNTEKAELSGGVTIRTMEQLASAMGCRFVYAIVPEGGVEELVSKQARKKAETVVSKASNHMALEAQSLDKRQIEYEINRLQQQFIRELPAELWND